MNTRERFLKTLKYAQVDHVPDMEFGYWQECFDVWHAQGLPQHLNESFELERYFGFEYYELFPVTSGQWPGFEVRVLEDKGDHEIIQGWDGVICERGKESSSIPKFIKHPIETREDWERFKKEQLNLETPGRFPDNTDAQIERLNNRSVPLGTPYMSLYGWLRNWMGVENVSIAIMTEPVWVEEMMDYLTDMNIAMLSRYVDRVQFDFGTWWEDMCYNHGPLVSPKFFNKVMVPRYKKITEFLAKHGVNYHQLDCDGKIDELASGWMDAGINIMFPIEAAHTDQERLRNEFGKDMLFMGGVNKVALIKGRDAIDAEMDRIARLLEDGGFIPHIDHRCPPDVTLDSYRYYIEKKREVLGMD